MTLPFKMKIETDMEAYRAATFWDKEPETIAWINTFENREVFFDIGANIGVYSLYAACRLPKSPVRAFEPHPGNFNRLVENILLNGFKNVSGVNVMLSDRYGKATFSYTDNEIGSSGGQAVPGGIDYTRALDELIDFSFDFPQPDHIKIDVDGNEIAILKGAKNTLKYVKSVLVEVSERTKSEAVYMLTVAGMTPSKLNDMAPHSRERRRKDGIDAENLIYVREI